MTCLRFLSAILLCGLLLGCDDAPEKKPAAVPQPKDYIRDQPGPADPDAPEEFTTTESGLKYRILRKSDGRKASAKDLVRVHYRGSFEDGKLFDSTYGRFGQSMIINMDNVIKAWQEGLQLVGEGGMIELVTPPELAYGDAGKGSIPPKATLHFLVEVIEVKSPVPAVEVKPN